MNKLGSTKAQNYIYLRSVASTNAFLSDYISKNKPSEHICAYTYQQTEGKGQIGRKWFSDINKNLSLSYFLPWPNIPVKDHFTLNMMICLSVLRSLEEIFELCDLKLKWPNDIYYKNKKLAGLLIQNQITSKSIASSIIGLGLNLNQQHFPEDLPFAISLTQITGTEFGLLESMFRFEHSFFLSLNNLLGKWSSVYKQYLDKLFGLGERRIFLDRNKNSFEGIIIGINEDGKLMVECNNQMHLFNHRDIQFIIE